ncbi:MAG: hypothetical protein HGA22_02855 [Clostridiales bacterium]|nr:hypothetical protein [Clostridiales bacterium]
MKKYSVEVVCVPECPTGHHPINLLVSLEDGPDEVMKVTDYWKNEADIPEKIMGIVNNISVCSMTGRTVKQKDYTKLVLNPDVTANTGKMKEI